jgi:2-hydroxychromene-2-carboxylate isomerase
MSLRDIRTARRGSTKWPECRLVRTNKQMEPRMGKEVEFLFDYGSPFSYLAALQIEGFAKRNNAAVVYTPILLGAVLKATGNASPMTVPAKGRYIATELRRWAARHSVPCKPNPYPFLSNTLRLMRTAVAAQKLGFFPIYHRAVYRAVWAEAQDLGDEATLRRVLDGAGVPSTKLMARSEDQDIKDELRQKTEHAVQRGVFGAPTFFVGDEMFWGNDRFDFVEEALRKLT